MKSMNVIIPATLLTPTDKKEALKDLRAVCSRTCGIPTSTEFTYMIIGVKRFSEASSDSLF